MKTVQDILARKGTEVWSASPDTTVLEALEQLAERNIGALVVLDGGKLVGIFSERDYARRVALRGRSSRDTPLRDVLTGRVLCVGTDRTVDECMALMSDKHIRHLPVVDARGQVVGLVSIGDVVGAVIWGQSFLIDQLEHYISGT
ncbi:MAG: CBS domain-containing protein [Deltaproteobacteria bacterium]|jgi:CBS domain-containing protein|nr:CBS domain-containing protein [Deltaproteobacteria bacterium]MBW2535139.1 CBS domain-containing protein [Deltaproteobacteria bacterium]